MLSSDAVLYRCAERPRKRPGNNYEFMKPLMNEIEYFNMMTGGSQNLQTNEGGGTGRHCPTKYQTLLSVKVIRDLGDRLMELRNPEKGIYQQKDPFPQVGLG